MIPLQLHSSYFAAADSICRAQARYGTCESCRYMPTAELGWYHDNAFVPYGMGALFYYGEKKRGIEMKQSELFLSTMRDMPSDAETASHRLLLRGGYMRQVAAGVYSYLPLGWKVLRNLQELIREEMERAGAQEMLMPAMQPTDLWRQSERYEVYGEELMRLCDRHEREFVLGPTHEEVVTALVRDEVNSYKRLPLTLYQIQTKYRDERRPRHGLLRCREFIMKDAYSFHLDAESLQAQYDRMVDAYHRVLQRLNLTYCAVEADAGAIGGSGRTHEFMALTSIGEDTIVSCGHCGYAANLEKAVSQSDSASAANIEALTDSLEAGHTKGVDTKVVQIEEARSTGEAPTANMPARVHTPGVKTIEELTAYLQVESSQTIKTLLYVADGEPVAVLVRGDHEVNETKVMRALTANKLELADSETVMRVTGAPTGFAGPVGLTIKCLVDKDAAHVEDAVVGANEQDYHLMHVKAGRDYALTMVGDYRNVVEGERCVHCGHALSFHLGIELGHVFELGAKYTDKLGAQVMNKSGQMQTLLMGCYGIGVSRMMSAIVEQMQHERGLRWPVSVAPYLVHVIPVSMKDAAQAEAASRLAEDMSSFGATVLWDDRDERFGVKLADADLIGCPIRIVIGKHIAEGKVELILPDACTSALVTVEQVVHTVRMYTNRS